MARALTMPNFNAALAPPRMQVPLDGQNNIGTVLGSAAVSTLSDIANTYTQAQQTKAQAMAAGQAMIDLATTDQERAIGEAYMQTGEQIKPNFFATSAGSGRSGGVSNIQGGMMDDVLKMLQKQVDQKNRLAVIDHDKNARLEVNNQEFGQSLAKESFETYNTKDILNVQLGTNKELADHNFNIDANIKTGEHNLRNELRKDANEDLISRDELQERQKALDATIEARANKQILPEDQLNLMQFYQQENVDSEQMKQALSIAITQAKVGAVRSSKGSSAKSSSDDDYVNDVLNKIK